MRLDRAGIERQGAPEQANRRLVGLAPLRPQDLIGPAEDSLDFAAVYEGGLGELESYGTDLFSIVQFELGWLD